MCLLQILKRLGQASSAGFLKADVSICVLVSLLHYNKHITQERVQGVSVNTESEQKIMFIHDVEVGRVWARLIHLLLSMNISKCVQLKDAKSNHANLAI